VSQTTSRFEEGLFVISCLMSWRSHGTTNATMVEALVRNNLIRHTPVKAAFLVVDRALFVNPTYVSLAYQDRPLPTVANVTISAPHMHAMMTELIYSHFADKGMEGKRVLDIGSGSGFLTAVLAELVGPSGTVVGVEHVRELVESSIAAIAACSPALSSRTRILEADGRLGWPSSSMEESSFDAIHVGAAAPTFPTTLAARLNDGGVMVVPVGPAGAEQELLVATKDESGHLHVKSAGGVMFVPLTSLSEQM
jgi:protein-L-isoaspartate(D-aspartate) O-methyltransferase